MSVAIGVRAQSEPRQLHATLAALRATTPASARIMILADDPDPGLLAGLHLPRLTASGAPACFNALCAASDEPHVVLLESGCLPAPGWLARLLAGLAGDPRNGLAGPSTNRSWNEQAAFPHASPAALAATARDAAHRFANAARTLEPLHSLADFCYLVRRDVVHAIGAADEGFGHGPCWEMDYNARAARAGFRGVWVGAAYVHRLPVTARRRATEARLFEASRRRYQDRLCGQRLRGERTAYASHCRGDACADFAPAALIPLRMTPPPPQPAPPTADPLAAMPAPRADLPRPAPVAAIAAEAAALPLVSCIMPTYQRRGFIARAIAGVLAQDWPHLELIIVDDGDDRIADLVPSDPRVRYLALDGRHPIGSKRNLACRAARGEIIAHFDDDDEYPPWRIRCQVAALRTAEACGTSVLYYRDGERAWRYDYAGPATWVAGNTLAYQRRWWVAHPFPEIQIGEDSRFVRALKPQQLVDLRDPALCIANIHADNVSPKPVGQTYWHAEDPAVLSALTATLPLVSCIMPTANRRAFVTLALQRFAEQDWPTRELVIVDDGADSVADLADQPNVRHLRLAGRHSLGGKRNLACQAARGAIIAHWDDDDWYAPDRLRRQIAPILRGDAALTGLTMRHLLQLASGEFWTASDALHRRMFVGDVSGGTLVFRRSLFSGGLRYPDTNLAEDAALIKAALARGHVLDRLENLGTYVYVRHTTNAWQFQPGHFLDPTGWSRTPPPAAFPAHQLAAYQAAR